jgi:hypothetical protein
LDRDCLNAIRLEAKKPTCVGFFVETVKLITSFLPWLVRPQMLLQERKRAQQQVQQPVQQERNQRRVQQPVQQLLPYHMRTKPRLTELQSKQSVSFCLVSYNQQHI